MHGRFNKGGLERWPFERFYCGCPLVTTNGFRVGTLCLGGDTPRKMSAHEVRTARHAQVYCGMAAHSYRVIAIQVFLMGGGCQHQCRTLLRTLQRPLHRLHTSPSTPPAYFVVTASAARVSQPRKSLYTCSWLCK